MEYFCRKEISDMKGNCKVLDEKKEKTHEYYYLFVLDGSDYQPMYEAMLCDLKENENVSFVIDDKQNTRLKTILLKQKVQALTKGKLDFLGFEKNKLFYEIERLQNKKVVVVFFNSSLHHNNYLGNTLFQYKKKWKNLKYVLFYLDIVGAGVSRNADYLRDKGLFDLIYSVDNRDCEKYGLIKYNTIYSINQSLQEIIPTKDLYFCGTSKDRSSILKECADNARKFGVSCSIDIAGGINSRDGLVDFPGINILEQGKYMNYHTVLKNELQSKCILEVCQKGQVALTLRPYEAVVYNRKILSNNKAILNFAFYDDRYMHYFEKTGDIDWEWVKSDCVVDYGYNGEFSPSALLMDISYRIQENNGAINSEQRC